MTTIDWGERTLQSELEFSKALGGKPVVYANFIHVYNPYWLFQNSTMVGWVTCANLNGYGRLFEVEIDEAFRGQGLGRVLLEAIRIEAGRQGMKYLLLQTGERLRRFYEQAGFRECASNSVIWTD